MNRRISHKKYTKIVNRILDDLVKEKMYNHDAIFVLSSIISIIVKAQK